MRRTAVTALAAALSATLVVAGCGSSDDGKPVKKKAAPAVDGQDVNAHPVSDLKQGGTLKMGLSTWPANFNWNTPDGFQGDATEVDGALLPDLFDNDAKGAQHANPNFLTSAKVVSTDPQVVEYQLNPKAKWSDGKPLSWKDFAAQWKALNGEDKDYEAAVTDGYEQISKVEQGKDAHGVRITFDKPYAEWQNLFDPVYPAAYIDTPEKFNKGWTQQLPVTANAFKVKSIDKTAQTITIVPDPDWWGPKPKLDSVVYRTIDFTASTEAYLNKEIDSATALLPEDYKRLVKAPGTDIRRGARWDEVHIALNGARGPLKDVRVRQALGNAIDRKGINTAFSKDLSFELKPLDNHLFMPNQEGYRSNAGEYGKYDPEKAGKLLDAAGWKSSGEGEPRTKGGKQLTLEYTLSAGSSSAQVDQAELVQQQLAAVGIKITLKKVPANDYFTKFVNTGNFDLTSFRNVDAVFKSVVTPTFVQPRGKNLFQNYGSIGSPKIDALLKKAQQTVDTTEANKLYNEADKELWKLGHSIELYQRPQIVAVRSGLANYGAEGLASRDYTKIGWLK
ncbi:ABC transporter family substrate-binding protein [Streptomyces sp. SID14478]|uniref:ABC transporter family substrate-binding protein n=1 Tax=Streptomyces sp. SID14478 TaxID=2706073 RepID=UPI0013DF9D92|nr:ABC transporter family substrate-binding protein [Streptomyces sp. SID14478]NEB81822.1 ABC transporter family substrate-binding protein [Streptomyces sp. SID14478]